MALQWSRAKPLLEAEVARLKDALAVAAIEDVVPLQQQIVALNKLKQWFESGDNPPEKIFDEAGY